MVKDFSPGGEGERGTQIPNLDSSMDGDQEYGREAGFDSK